MSEEKKLTKQEENWMLMTTLQIPWKDANAIDDPSDREFLLEKVKEVQKYMLEQEKVMEQMRKDEAMPQSPSGNIITPQDILQGK